MNLDSKKATSKEDISANFLRVLVSRHLPFLRNINSSFTEQKEFPDELKIVDVVPIFKKKDPLNQASKFTFPNSLQTYLDFVRTTVANTA